MILKRIPDAELQIMEFIWSSENPISSKELINIMEEKNGWKNTTTLTLVSRLVTKRFISVKKQKRISYYSPIITRKSYLERETSSFFHKLHSNSLKSFITTLHENHDITDEDLNELEEWIKNR